MVLTNKVLSADGIFNTGLTVNYSSAGAVTTNGVTINPVHTDNGDSLVIGNLQVTGTIYANSKSNSFGTFTPNIHVFTASVVTQCTVSGNTGRYSKVWNGTNYTINVLISATISNFNTSGTVIGLYATGLPLPAAYTNFTVGGTVFSTSIGYTVANVYRTNAIHDSTLGDVAQMDFGGGINVANFNTVNISFFYFA